MIGNYTALDLETTGLNPKYDKIIEVGAVKVRNGEIIDSFQQLVCPGIALPEKITGLTGITQEELLEAKGSETVIPQLLDFLEDDVILGHSVMFDYSFLKKAAVNQNLWRPEQSHLGLDTLRLSRIYLPELPSRRLADLCLHYGIRHQAHGHWEMQKARYSFIRYCVRNSVKMLWVKRLRSRHGKNVRRPLLRSRLSIR